MLEYRHSLWLKSLVSPNQQLSPYEEGYLRGKLEEVEQFMQVFLEAKRSQVDKRKKKDVKLKQETDPLAFLAKQFNT